MHKKYLEILKILKGEAENIYNLPDSLFQWFTKNYSNLLDIETMKEYHILHDCGKPYCLTYDKDDDTLLHTLYFSQQDFNMLESYSEKMLNDAINNLTKSIDDISINKRNLLISEIERLKHKLSELD